jgi:uncharacterized protein
VSLPLFRVPASKLLPTNYFQISPHSHRVMPAEEEGSEMNEKTSAACVKVWLLCMVSLFWFGGDNASPIPDDVVTYDGFNRVSLYIPSGDGTKLAIDVYRPTKNGVLATEKTPVIFTQDRSEERDPRYANMFNNLIRAFTQHGYAWVAQDRRGTGASFGVQKGFITRDDRMDGRAVVEWAGSQPWSNGKVGSLGCSNQGEHQYALLTEHPKYLVAIAPECAAPTFFDTTQSINGVSSFAQGTTPPYAGECNQKITVGIPVDSDPAPDFPLAHAAAEEHKCNANFLGQYQANMYRDTLEPYLNYRPGIVDSPAMQSESVKTSGVKILNVDGWFDASPAAVLLAWQMWGGRVVLGPWVHAGTTGPGDSFPNSKLDRAKLYLRWSDYTLKGESNGFDTEPPIRYYTIHSELNQEWRWAAQWPLPNQIVTRFFFSGGKSASVNSLNDGVLASDRPTGADFDSYRPDYSADLFGGKYAILNRYWGGDMRSGTDEKGLTYTLAPLTADLEVTGHPIADFWVTSTAADEDFFAILEDVAADGRSTYVTDGKIRASRRKLGTPPWGDFGLPWHPQLAADDQPLSPDTPSELLFDFLPTSYVFKKGERIRITIVNNGGKSFQPPSGHDRANPPTIHILRSAKYPSSITLPVIPPGSSVFVGHMIINTGAVQYDGQSSVYWSTARTYVRYGNTWTSFENATIARHPGKSEATCAAKGPLGNVKVSLIEPKWALWSIRIVGKGIDFSGEGKTALEQEALID